MADGRARRNVLLAGNAPVSRCRAMCYFGAPPMATVQMHADSDAADVPADAPATPPAPVRPAPPSSVNPPATPEPAGPWQPDRAAPHVGRLSRWYDKAEAFISRLSVRDNF